MINPRRTITLTQSYSKYRRVFFFGFIGCLNTMLDIGIFLFLFEKLGFSPIGANTVSFLIACTNSYFLNRRFTFSDRLAHATKKGHFTLFLRFLIVSLSALLISNLIVFLVAWVAHPIFGKILAIGTNFALNYTGVSQFVFPEQRKETR